jgi:arginine repressor
MSSPKPKFIAEKLYEEARMNDREITDALRELGVDVTQPTVNRIRCGLIKRTSHDIGRGLEELYRERFPQQQSA